MSSSDFLTFSRRLAGSSALRQSLLGARPQVARPFSVSVRTWAQNDKVKTDQYPDGEHATDKKDKLDVQSEQSNKGKE